MGSHGLLFHANTEVNTSKYFNVDIGLSPLRVKKMDSFREF